jgi:hypothetical protein
MQSKIKLGEADGIFELSDLALYDDLDASTIPFGETGAKSSTALRGELEECKPVDLKTAEAFTVGEYVPSRAAAGGDEVGGDVPEWLKSIKSAPVDDLEAKFWPPRIGASLSSDTPETSPEPALSDPGLTPRQPRENGAAGGALAGKSIGAEDFGEERALARKLVYRVNEPPHAPPRALQAAALPYIAATALFVFVSGGALAYFTLGASSDAVTDTGDGRGELQPSPAAVRADQIAFRKGGIQRSGTQNTSVSGTTPSAAVLPASVDAWGVKAEERAPKQGDLEASAPQQLDSWSDMVETFKQLVKAEVQKTAAKSENAQ